MRLRSEVIKPYIQELDRNVSSRGVPTMRPLAYEFPADPKCRGVNDQYMLGPSSCLHLSSFRTRIAACYAFRAEIGPYFVPG